MPNTILTPSIIAKEALVQLMNATVLSNLVYRNYDNEFSKVGDTISLRKPVYYDSFAGPDITSNINDTIEGAFPLNLNFHRTVPLSFLERDLTLTIDDFSDRYLKSAGAKLAQDIESAIAGLYNQVWNYTPATTLGSPKYEDLGFAGTILTNSGVPYEERRAVLGPNDRLQLSKDLKTVFVQDKVKTALERTTVGTYANFDTYESVSMIRHTAGAQGGTPLVNGANQTSTYTAVRNTNTQNLVTNGWSASVNGVLKAGDVINLAGVFAVNIRTKQSTGRLQDFVVTADANSDASGNCTLVISPAIITTGPYQTVTNAPASAAAITVATGSAGTVSTQNLCFHKNAFVLAMRPFQKPDSAVYWEQKSMNGFSLTLNKQWDAIKYQEITRLDILFGVAAVHPNLAARFRAI